MLFKDFFFGFKNIHVSLLEKKKISKLIRVGISILYKFFVLELIIYNFFYKKDLDTISIKKKELFNKDLSFLFKSLKVIPGSISKIKGTLIFEGVSINFL